MVPPHEDTGTSDCIALHVMIRFPKIDRKMTGQFRHYCMLLSAAKPFVVDAMTAFHYHVLVTILTPFYFKKISVAFIADRVDALADPAPFAAQSSCRPPNS